VSSELTFRRSNLLPIDDDLAAAWDELHKANAFARLVHRPAHIRAAPTYALGAIRVRSARGAEGRAAQPRMDSGRPYRVRRRARDGALPAGDRRRARVKVAGQPNGSDGALTNPQVVPRQGPDWAIGVTLTVPKAVQ